MKIIEFLGGPGAGKTTLSTRLFSRLKQDGKRVEFVREYAQELIFAGQEHLLADSNQLNVLAGQYTKYKNLERLGYDLIISDSSMSLSAVYASDTTLNNLMNLLSNTAEEEFDIIKIFVTRDPDKNFNEIGRIHTYSESLEADEMIRKKCGPFTKFLLPNDNSVNDLLKLLEEDN